MKLGTTVRGSQKVYFLFNAHCPDGGSIRADSKVMGGDNVPALVLAKDAEHDEYVLVLPLLHADQVVTIRIFDDQGSVIEEKSKIVRHLSNALAGKLNTLSKAPGIEKIRNFDSLARPDVSRIIPGTVCGLGLESENSEIVTVGIVAPCMSAFARKAPFSVQVFDRKGNEIQIEDLVVLGDAIEHPVKHSPYAQRKIDLSFRKSRRYEWICVSIEFEDEALPPGMLCISKEQMSGARGWFESRFENTGAGPRYEDWFFNTQATPPVELEAQRSVSFEIEPLYSIIVPLFKTPLSFLHEMIGSVLGQTYSKFELILVNASPEDKPLCSCIAEYAEADDRVKIVTLEENMGIALNTNEGIRAAQGDFLSFFDHDDVLEPDLLFEYTDAINRYPETDLLFCDEDKLIDGHYADGLLKPDFSWDLLTSFNYVCHLLTVRKSIVDEVELSDESVSGAQDWDMTMKVAEKARNIYHVPKVLYHWRVHKGSVASGSDAKPYTHFAGERAIQNHFDRIGVPVRIHDAECDNIHWIEYLLPEEKPLVSIIIPSKDHIDLLGTLLDSVFEKTTYPNYEIVIVENNSDDEETFAFYEQLQAEHSNVRVVMYEGPFNFSAVCNFGAKSAQGDYLLFLNNDMKVITPDWLELLLGPLQREDVGAVGAQLLFPDDTVQHAGVILLESGPTHVLYRVPVRYSAYFGFNLKKRDVLAVTGACIMISRKAFDDIEGFDESFVVEYNDVDFCLRLRERGLSVVIEPRAQLYHYESVSRGSKKETKEKKQLRAHELSKFKDRWAEQYAEGDPTYGRSISRGSISYELDWSLLP